MNLNQDTKPEHAFYCADGRVLKNLTGLAEELNGISPEAYRHHANESRNDFSNWIKDVYGNWKLAKKIASAKNSAEAAAIIEKALAPKATRKKKTAEMKKTVAVKRKRTRKKRKKTAAAAVAAKKKGKKKPTLEKAKKTRRTKRRRAKRKIMLHKMVHSHLKRIARQFGFL